MNKLLLLLLIGSCFMLKGYGQLIVNDPNANLSLAKSITAAAEQLKQLKKQAQILEDAQKKVQKVNKKVRELNYYKRLFEINGAVIKMVRENVGELLKSPAMTEKNLATINRTFKKVIDQSAENLLFVKNMLADNYFELSDFERLTLLEKKEKEMEALQFDAQFKLKHYKQSVQHAEWVMKVNEMAEKSKKAPLPAFGKKNN